MKREKTQPAPGHIRDPELPVIRASRAANGMEYRCTEARLPQGAEQMTSENRRTEQI